MFQDIRFGFRQLLRKPGFAALAIISMALGIGANTSIFSLLDTALLRPLPVQEPSQLVELYGTLHKGAGRHPPVLSELQRLPRSQHRPLRLVRLSRRRQRAQPRREESARLGLPRFRQLLRRSRREACARSRLSAGGRSNARLASGHRAQPRLLGTPLRQRSGDHRPDGGVQRPPIHRRGRRAERLHRHRGRLSGRDVRAHDDGETNRARQQLARAAAPATTTSSSAA